MSVKLERLDKLLVTKQLVESRTIAREYIESGRVFVDGIQALKPASQASPSASIKIDMPQKQWVSRGAYKLLKAFEFFGIDADDKVCLDIGASTGGFTDVLLSKGAKHVFAVDVGYGQLAWKLRTDERVSVMERTNARFLTLDMLKGQKPDIIVSDASFISLKLLLKPLEVLLHRDGNMVLLLKPQFEVGKEHIGKGVVTDPALHISVIDDMLGYIDSETSLKAIDATFSPIRGPEGNIEFLLWLVNKENSAYTQKLPQTTELVREAHESTLKRAGQDK